MDRFRSRCDRLAIWILWSTWCSAAGWLLSAFGALDRTGYTVALVLFVGALLLTRGPWTFATARPLFLLRRSTYRRVLPKLWLALVVMSLIGGLCYHGDNYDYLTYRFPRVLHWWWAHRWYWIDTTTDRMNFSASGFEWLMAPIFVFLQSDRPFFLINFASFLLLPGLVFSVFRRLGARGRTAWWWMWTLPAGLCYALEAGGVGNDMFAGVYVLAAFYYGWKARAGSAPALALAILSIALLTNCKVSNVPLALPCLALLALDRRALPRDARGWAIILGACLVGLLVSGLPTLVANAHFSGDYGGDPANRHHVRIGNPLAGVIGNALILVFANFSPPLLPHEITWTFLFPPSFLHFVVGSYPRFQVFSPALALEETGSLGLGVTLFLLLSLGYGLRAHITSPAPASTREVKWLALATLGAWLFYMAKLGSEAAPRLVAPYYIVTTGVMLGLLPFDGVLTRRKAWRGLAILALVMGLVVVGLNPGRPLIPVPAFSALLHAVHAPAGVAAEWTANAALRAGRFDDMEPLRTSIPDTEKVVGLVGGFDNPQVSLWLPFGSRETVEFDPTCVSRAELLQRNVHYLVVSEEFVRTRYHLSQADLMQKWPSTVVRSEQLIFKTKRDPESWYLLHLD